MDPIDLEKDSSDSLLSNFDSEDLPRTRSSSKTTSSFDRLRKCVRWLDPLTGASKRESLVTSIHVLIFFFNLLLLLFGLYRAGKSYCDPRHPGHFVYSPANEAVKYEARTFNGSLYVTDKYNSGTNEQIDEAWNDLVQPQSMWVTAEELQKLSRTSVALAGNQGYLASLGVFHHLHCLNYVRRWVHNSSSISEDHHTVKIHISHCINSLRRYVQCAGDTSTVTYSWRPDYRNPWPDFQEEHQCRSYEMLKQWAMARVPHRVEGGRPYFENPIFDHNIYDEFNIPTSIEGTTELVSGTRANPKVMKLAGGDPY